MHLFSALLALLLTTTATSLSPDSAQPATKVSRELVLPAEKQPAVDTITDALPTGPVNTLSLKVGLVIDEELAPLSEEEAKNLLAIAQKTLADRLAFNELSFDIVRTVSLKTFIQENLAKDPACLPGLEELLYTPDKKPDFKKLKPRMLAFLKHWPLEDLQAFFPQEERKRYASYEKILLQLIKTYQQKMETISQITLENGSRLLAPEKVLYRSYSSWICALRAQDDFDLILTNGFILYDLASEPYPHTIFQKCKVGGASLNSPRRRVIPQRALFASTFGMYNKIPFFDEDPEGRLTDSEKQQIIGQFILAHELAHALFKLPDFYDHPAQCLMTTKAETDYVTGYNILKNNPGSCPRCQPWIAARRRYFQAQWLADHGQAAQAIPLFQEVLKTTPKQIDGSYRAFAADIGVNVARCHHQLGEELAARRWLKSAAKMDPYSPLAKELWQEWYGSSLDGNN